MTKEILSIVVVKKQQCVHNIILLYYAKQLYTKNTSFGKDCLLSILTILMPYINIMLLPYMYYKYSRLRGHGYGLTVHWYIINIVFIEP